MRIGEVARLAGVSARSIRHYHRLGVLDEPPRTSGGYRDYDVGDLARIARIAFLNGSGVPLREIGALLGDGGGNDDAGASTSGGAGTRDAAADLAAIRAGIDEQIETLVRQRDRLEAIARRVAEGQTLQLLPVPVSRALDTCRAEVTDDPELTALIDREHDMLDLVALNGQFPDALTSSYTAIGADPERRRGYLDMLAGFHAIEGRPPSRVEPEINRLVDALLSDPDLRALVTGPEPGPESRETPGPTPEPEPHQAASAAAGPYAADQPGPTLDQLLPDPAQREVLRRTLTALGVLP